MQIATQEDREQLLSALTDKKYTVLDMTDNEAAKLHVRHMVDGRNSTGQNEMLFRFEFPERPGALLNFLSGIGSNWDISLFHYRNHGAAYGRVLVGFVAAPGERKKLLQYLRRIGYRFFDETDNPAYAMFLG